ncbi:TonB-dependent receptor [Nitrospirillum amazonense]|uniref:Iron complex outermembrane receptor protein n=1 Tax=Nitrospirillum amazonense TaxID=28077 RepID=A0A560KII5_9PROT|nr:TonB-dependent receptor [Nitrospirillum amazonense]MDG3444477.1 TonB-dependent receptor [Nitrospirillum amazonense]TWB82919.1 iron complex outermembrane receptor protein [Nitrospirillum amazonense]
MKKLNRAQAPGRRYATFLKLGTGMVALATATAWVAPALAQSTASEMDEIVITGARKQPNIAGLIQAETSPKSRSTVTQEYLATQTAGQSVLASLNLLPGVNFTNNDAYGSSGGNIRIRGFDGNRVSLTFDGIPLNDTGNYAIYSNQVIDEELVNRATVNIGTTDVDSPTASATGGTINVQTRKPLDELGVEGKLSFGSNSYKRIFTVLDTGDFGPGNRTSAFLAASYQDYDKFKGYGSLQKKQFNTRIYEDLGGGDFISVAAHYNENRNNSYQTNSRATFASNYFADYNNTWVPQTAVNGKADTVPSTDSNYYNVRVNPSNTGNIRGQSRFHLSDDVMLTVDPYFQYTLANGGGTTSIKETDPRLIGTSKTAKGVDLNGDGDLLDTVLLYAPSNTNTFRSGVTSSLIWDIDDNNRLRVGYTLDYGRHRQTGDFSYIGADGTPLDVFGGKNSGQIYAADGSQLEARNRYSIAELNQASLEYVFKALDQKLTVVPALRLPFFHRELNQYCYTYTSTSTNVASLSSNQYCTTNPTITQTNLYRTPFTGTKDFSDPLPSLGVVYQITPEHQVYFQFSEGFSAPRTDNLYGVKTDQPGIVDPEKTYNFELGERFQTNWLMTSVSGWYTRYINRIVSALDPNDANNTIDRSLGRVDLYGASIEAGFAITDQVNFYTSGSYTHSEVKNNLAGPAGYVYNTSGKQLVDTPEWMAAGRVEYKPLDILSASIEGKYTGTRAATDVNDEWTTPFFVANFETRLDLPDAGGFKGTYLQFNVNNLFDRRYLNTISSSTSIATVAGKSSLPFYQVGAPRTFMGTIHTSF